MVSLDTIGLRTGTDKSSAHHNYLHTYEKYFAPLRDKNILLFEAGVGGYTFANRGGESLRMWCEYFKNGRVVTIDLYDKTQIVTPNNAEVYKCSQTDGENIIRILNNRQPDIIIDDASHINPVTITTFQIMFPLLKSGGIYVVEDTETSYWSAVATDGTDFKGGDHPNTVMNYFKRKADEVNLIEKTDIEAVHFYKGLIIILKK